ncbi:hypothetical protein LSM04_000397 [Trypanosoma melophagium]|uniref:uncharacterized protein n=1 Tax=Trypanosoma melophagium TaxID=715481 RepID=UPI00351A3649|nr:hypothetical protein LSM04_000397 [Trypanosoma melophagium]
MHDPLLNKDVIRLSPQYDASSFLRSCPINEAYRILASISRSNEENSDNAVWPVPETPEGTEEVKKEITNKIEMNS